ncbi:MAG: 4-hydroxy-tetrahydrodipicolinate synthase [Fusobacteriaceae bacterium]
MTIFTGSGVALITPFKENKEVNFEKLNELLTFQIENKTDAIIINGTTGEASTLSEEEQLELIDRTVKFVGKKIPVIAGTGSNNTAHAIKLSCEAQKLGVDGLLVITPYYNKTNTKGLVEHFKKIASAVNIPIILYNVPGRTGMSISMEVLEELKDVKNIVGIKEASGDMTYAMNIARIFNDRYDIYSGNDDIILPMTSIGGKGVISVLANVLPLDTHNIVYNYLEGRVQEAKELQLRLNGFVHSLFIETNPIPVKRALNILGWKVGGYRLPLYEMSESASKIMEKEMKKIGL